MLYIHVDRKNTKEYLTAIDYYFNTHKNKDWSNDSKEIDNTIAVKDEYLESPIFGGMAPERLSTGTKALILMYETDEIVFATRCGDNCAPIILDIAKKKRFAYHAESLYVFSERDTLYSNICG